jgi:signal transduction histidine kinase
MTENDTSVRWERLWVGLGNGDERNPNETEEAPPPRQLKPIAALVAVGLVGSAVTAAVALLPWLRFAYRAEPLHVAIETAAALVAILVAFLVYGRARRAGQRVNAVLLAALALLALTNLLFTMLPAIVPELAGRVTTWSAISGHALAAALLAVAAFTPVARSWRAPWVAFPASAALVALVVGVVALLQHHLPEPVTALVPESSGRPNLVGHGAVLAVQLLIAALYAVAATGFAIRAERRRDAFTAWLAIGAALGALSRVNYFLYPSLYSKWVYTGDFFRLAFYVALLLGALQEITTYWRAVSDAAVLEERRRIARDLHDGVAQEVAYITRASKMLQAGGNGSDLERLSAAAERALRESRQAIAALAAPAGEPLDAVLVRMAEETSARFGVDVELDVPPTVRLDPARTEALLRIAGEALTNAARHSNAQRLRLVVEWRTGHLWLRVSDDGRGFDTVPRPSPSAGFGLTSMRERAASVGAEFRLRSRPGAGTQVEVRL